MSNAYPPPFGGPYPGYPFDNMGVRDGIPSTMPGGPPLPHHIGAYTASTPPNPSPAINNHNFRANAAVSNTNTPHPIPPPVPPPFHVTPDLFRQFAQSSLPPPPHPPVPIPHLGFPHFPPPPPNFAVAPTPPNDHQASYSSQYQQPQVPLPSPPALSQHAQSANIGTREEGELSDGELDESSPESTVEPSRPVGTNQTDVSLMPSKAGSSTQEGLLSAHPTASAADLISADPEAQVIKQASGASRGGFSESAKMGNVFHRPAEVENDRAPSTDNESISSYNPPSASTPDPGQVDVDPVDPLSNGLQVANPSIPSKISYPDNTNNALREQVKDALRSLAPHNIKYNELVGEGVDPYLLQGLYEELDSNEVHPRPSSSSIRSQRANSPKIALQEKQPVLDVTDHSSSGADQHLQQAANTANFKSSLPSVTSVPETSRAPSVPATLKGSASVSINTEKPTIAAPSSTVAMERKDRIAQLLAAKTGKALPPRPAPEKPSVPSPKVSVSESPIEAVKKPQSLPEKPPLPIPESSARPKNKAQTELIRQKMEALKREALAKAQGEGTTKVGSITSSTILALLPTALQPQQPRAPVDTADVDSNELEAQIPGLFMTSEESPSFPHSMNGTAENVIKAKPVDPISVSSTATPLSRGTSAEIESESVRSPGGHSLPVRVPQKRPLAADSFDEPALSAKRPFGRKDSSGKVEIIISDAESEGEVEYVEMELDEESDEENKEREDVSPAVSLKQQNIRNLPPLTGMPTQKPILPSAGDIGTPTATALQTPSSTGAQTPGKDNDKEQLWKAKNKEIELMRKKIAEMEERRKVKQNANLTHSPNTAGKASLPAIRTSLTRPSQAPSSGPAHSGSVVSASPKSEPAKQPVVSNAENPSDPTKSPALAACKPDGLPSTPSTPLYAIKEPLKAEDLRQQLLARKLTRERTPSVAEMELRQAQLAEKRAKLAELRREAERREAEILEESKLLDAQLQAELNDEPYGQPLSESDGKVEGETHEMDRAASDDIRTDVQGADPEELPGAVMASPVSVPQGLVPANDNIVPPANEGAITMEKPVFYSTEGFLPPDTGAVRGLPEHPPHTMPSVYAEITTAPPHVHSPEVPVVENAHVDANFLPPVNEDEIVHDIRHDTVDSNLLDDDGSVSMSASASEDYEPAEPDQMLDYQTESDSESYEPVDPGVPTDPTKSPTSKQEFVEPIETEQTLGQSTLETTSSTTKNSEPPIMIDDVEDGMQLTEPDIVNKPQLLSQSQGNETYDKFQVPISHFTPYETPRRYFKNFRYYDGFPEMVTSGYKSLTFSNNIDSRKPFCPTELAGKACEDPTCEEQHFRQIAMTDDKILAQMSTANNLRTKAEHDRWVAGLRQVIADLRSKGVKDFHMVASALAAYRRRFSEELSTSTSASSQS